GARTKILAARDLTVRAALVLGVSVRVPAPQPRGQPAWRREERRGAPEEHRGLPAPPNDGEAEQRAEEGVVLVLAHVHGLVPAELLEVDVVRVVDDREPERRRVAPEARHPGPPGGVDGVRAMLPHPETADGAQEAQEREREHPEDERRERDDGEGGFLDLRSHDYLVSALSVRVAATWRATADTTPTAHQRPGRRLHRSDRACIFAARFNAPSSSDSISRE